MKKKRLQRFFIAMLLTAVIGILAFEAIIWCEQYFALKTQTKSTAWIASFNDRMSSDSEPVQFKTFKIPTQIMSDCDNNADGKVDDPATLSFAEGWWRTRFLTEFARCGAVGEMMRTNYIWIFTQSQAPTHLTQLFGLPPYPISALESVKFRRQNIALVTNGRLFSEKECVNSAPRPCINLKYVSQFIHYFVKKLPLDQLFIVSFDQQSATEPPHKIVCEIFSFDSIRQTGCHNNQANTLEAAILKASDLLSKTEKDDIPILILIKDKSDQTDTTDIQNLFRYSICITMDNNRPASSQNTNKKCYIERSARNSDIPAIFLEIINLVSPKIQE